MSKKRFLAGFMGLLLLITSVFTGNVMTVKAVTDSTICFNDQTSEGETSKAYEYGSVEYKIGDGEWTRVTSAAEISISTTATVYFRLIANENYQVDMTRNVNLYSDSGSQTLTVNTDDESGTVTGTPNAQYFTFTPEVNEETQTLYGYEICFGFEAVSQSGNGGGEQQDVSFSCTSMNGKENERVEAVEVSIDGGSNWVNYSDGALNTLSEPTTFKVRIKMNEGFTIDKVSLDYESFDHNSRVGYFKENNQPDYDAIIRALLSDNGYEITFQPEEDSKDAGGNSTLQTNSTCLRLQYQTAIVYDDHVDINMFFQIKDGDNGYGIWKEYVFEDGVGDSGVIFSFNDNNYGENGEPFDLGYGKENAGENPIQVSYVSKYAETEGQTVTVTPDTYDYFSAGGYTSGDDKNEIRIDDYDGLIDEVYIDVDGDDTFGESEKLTAKEGYDPYIGSYKYYKETLNAADSYNILVRKHLSTRVSLKWSYTESGTDFYVDHGKIFIEKVVRGEDILYQAQVNDESGDLVLDGGVPIATTNSLGSDYGVSSSAGEVFLECGDEVTIRLIPTYGYQIESATLNDVVELTPNDNVVSAFTFTVGGNLHMAGTFVETTDETDTTGAENINYAGITDGHNATDSGNLKLTVADHSGTYENASEALEIATDDIIDTGATTFATLDMTLNSMVSKGNGDYWTDDITSFENKINVNLELNDTTYVPGDTYVVVREHDGELVKLETTYSNGMLEVPTNQFSTYSIVKIPVSEENRPNMYLEYDPRGEGDEAGSVTVKCNGAELTGTDGYYKYSDPAQEITFELKRPADRVDTEIYTPVVEVVFPQENDADTVVKYPTVTNDTFTVTPSTDSGLSGSPFMEVYVHWSEYDKLGPDENEFMFFLNQPYGGGSYEFQNGLYPLESATLGNESKYIFANGTEVSVELKPDANKELAEVFLFQDDQGIHYSGDPDAYQEEPEEQRNIEDLKVGDKYILSGLSPWAFVDVFFIDIPMLSDITLNTSGTLYDSMKGSDVTVSSTCKIGEEVINGTTKLKDQDSYLLAGTNNYVVEFTSEPDEHGESFTVEGTISLTVEHNNVSGSGSGSGSGSSGSSSSGGTTTPAPTTPAETEVTTPIDTENTTTATTTEENNEETASETKIGVASEEGAEGWTEIKTEISDKLTGVLEAEEGEELVVAVEMSGEDTVPADVFEAIEGQDITVTFDMGNGIVWAVNGMDVTAGTFKDINFAAATGDGVTAIPVALKTSLVDNRFSMELTLEFEGEFGLTAVMSVDVKKENAGKYANLFYFNPQSETMEYICSAQIKEDGTADLTFTHASDYVIVVDEVIMSVADNTSMEQVQEAAPQETPVEMSSVEKDTAENDSFNLFWIIAVGILILVVGTIAILAVKNKKE